MSVIRVIFLDIDGVIVVGENKWQTPAWNRASIEALRKIVREVENCKIVLSSTWRLKPYLIYEFVRMCNQEIGENILIGMTPHIDLFSRDKEIFEHLRLMANSHFNQSFICNYVKKWIVVDDAPEFFTSPLLHPHNLHFVDRAVGLTDDDANKIIDFFKGA